MGKLQQGNTVNVRGRLPGVHNWSVRKVVTMALVLSFMFAVPLVGIVYWRLFQIGEAAPVWAEVAEASRWMSSGLTCAGGTQSLDGKPAALEFVHSGYAPGANSLFQGHAALDVVHAGIVRAPYATRLRECGTRSRACGIWPVHRNS